MAYEPKETADIIEGLHQRIAALTAERDRLAEALLHQRQDFECMRESADVAHQITKELLIERDQLRAALEAVEWGGRDALGQLHCPNQLCGRVQGARHAPDCIVGLALKTNRTEQNA